MAAKNRQEALLNAAFAYEFTDFVGEFGQSGAVSANREDEARLAKHGAA
jgi:hypothetical protein